MKHTWKILLSVCVMAVCVIGFAGCGGSEPADNDATEAAVEQTTTEESLSVSKIIGRQLNKDAAEYYSGLEDQELFSVVANNETQAKDVENEYSISGTVSMVFEDSSNWKAEYEGSATVDGDTCVLHDMKWGEPVKTE